ncbi:19820_t:CDS:2, partial [Racocetra fulgida]
MKNSNDTPASNISDNTSDSDDVSNFDICQESENQYLTSPILVGPKSSEDDDFLDSTYKEKVSKKIIQSIREKKFQVQEKIITSQDIKSSLSVKGGQGLIQELFTLEPSLQESNIIQNHTIGISETGGPGKSNIDEASQHLAQLYNVGHQISSENTEILAHLGKILPISEDSSSTLAKAETNIDYDDVYFDEEFDDDVYFDEEVASRSDKVEPGQRSSSNQALSHDDSDHSYNNDSEEEMPDESDDDRYSRCGGYNEYGESDRGYYYDL